jgi:hypothetical protein
MRNRATRPGRTVTDGHYVARFRMARDGRAADVRRIALRRSGGRWSVGPAFDRRSACGLLRSVKLERPVFGGHANRRVGVAYRLGADAEVRVEVRRGARTVQRFAPVRARAHRTYRLRLAGERWARGDHRVVVTVRRGADVVRWALTTRRL